MRDVWQPRLVWQAHSVSCSPGASRRVTPGCLVVVQCTYPSDFALWSWSLADRKTCWKRSAPRPSGPRTSPWACDPPRARMRSCWRTQWCCRSVSSCTRGWRSRPCRSCTQEYFLPYQAIQRLKRTSMSSARLAGIAAFSVPTQSWHSVRAAICNTTWPKQTIGVVKKLWTLLRIFSEKKFCYLFWYWNKFLISLLHAHCVFIPNNDMKLTYTRAKVNKFIIGSDKCQVIYHLVYHSNEVSP